MKRTIIVGIILLVGSLQISIPSAQKSLDARCTATDKEDHEARIVIGFGVANACSGSGSSQPTGPRGPGTPQSPIPNPNPGGIAY
jgi:hypothetical protein